MERWEEEGVWIQVDWGEGGEEVECWVVEVGDCLKMASDQLLPFLYQDCKRKLHF